MHISLNYFVFRIVETGENWRRETAVHVSVPIHSVTGLSFCRILFLNQWLRLQHWTLSRVALTMPADIYVSEPISETFYSSITDQSTGLQRPTSATKKIDDDDYNIFMKDFLYVCTPCPW